MSWLVLTGIYYIIIIALLISLKFMTKHLKQLYTRYKRATIEAILDAVCDLGEIMVIPAMMTDHKSLIALLVMIVLLVCLYLLRNYIKVDLDLIEHDKTIPHAPETISTLSDIISRITNFFKRTNTK
ncbi:hypothetical protein [Lactobacillus ultunensis]|uniref:hypothetical protein n=1 Tax=Lactobacillus ultunensis TaxID=227945 RepID=UPI00058EF504|nr:hypothetical protein [Lactobacillus ultunensis]QQP28200.1 hypothetical protein H4B44_08860 [Lactobacillus ultunensis]